ncbi:hypothetical protein MTO96_041282 [Rhipicephalus appendiculatus]
MEAQKLLKWSKQGEKARGWKRRGQPKTSFCPGVPETGVGQDVPVQVPVPVDLSKVLFRWPLEGPRTRPGERLLPGCSSRGWARGRGLPTSVSTALHRVAHPCAVNRACRAASALTHVDEHMLEPNCETSVFYRERFAIGSVAWD